MRILFEELTASLRTGGIEAACSGLATELSALGQDVVRHDGTEQQAVNWRPNVVHVHGIWSPALVRRWCSWRSAGVHCMITVHGMLEPWALAHKKWKKRIAWLVYQRRMLQAAACLHATSEREAANLRTLGLKPPTATIPWGVTVNRISSVKGRKRQLDKKCSDQSAFQESSFQKTNQSRIALFVGRIYPVKGLPLLLEAWARLRPLGWRLQLVGPNEAGHRSELEALSKKLGLKELVEFLGPREGCELQETYRQADLFILPSYTENFGIAVAEAMAHGLPVITTHGAPWELLESEACGWWVPVSADGLAIALDCATRRSPDDLAAMGERGRKVVEERFAWDRVAHEMLTCYEWLVRCGPKPRCVVG